MRGKSGAPKIMAKTIKNILPPIVERGVDRSPRRLIDDHYVVVFKNQIRLGQRKVKPLRFQMNSDDGALGD